MNKFAAFFVISILMDAGSASAEEKIPKDVLISMLSATTAVHQSCAAVKPSPGFMKFMGSFRKQIDQITKSEADIKTAKAEVQKISELIAQIGCGSFADIMNERAKNADLGMPMFVRD